jgi:hypothetical protein
LTAEVDIAAPDLRRTSRISTLYLSTICCIVCSVDGRQHLLQRIDAMSAVYALTIFHVLISLVAIVAGIPVVYGFLKSQIYSGWTKTYIVATALTLITSFLFPLNGFTPAIGVGILCILIFIPTLYAKYRTSLTGIWRLVYVAGSVALLYFNCFVLIVQSFQKVPGLHELAPKGDEPPFLVAQVVLLLVAIVLGIFSVRRFHAGAPALKIVR